MAENENKNKYTNRDKGPYNIIVIKEKTSEMGIGRLLRKADIIDNHIQIIQIDWNKYKIMCKSSKTANKILKDSEEEKLKLKAYIPNCFLYTTGFIKGVELDITMEELKTEINTNIPFEEIRRMNIYDKEKKKLKQSRNIIIKFRATTLPQEITIFGSIKTVQHFIPKLKQCTNCLKIGHVSKHCKNEKICFKCTEKHKDNEECTNNIKCINCGSSSHHSFDMSCEFKIKQIEILTHMIKNKVSFKEAKKIILNIKNKNEVEGGNESWLHSNNLIIYKRQTNIMNNVENKIKQLKTKIINEKSQKITNEFKDIIEIDLENILQIFKQNSMSYAEVVNLSNEIEN